MMPHHARFEGGAMEIIMIIFWWVVIVANTLAVSGLIPNRHPSHQSEDVQSLEAFEILRRRYTRGEIDKQRYEAMRRDLTQDHAH
jgi:uncharacterized membrane protein